MFIVFFALAGCDLIKANQTLPLEMIAFNSLTAKEQELIPVSPKDATVEKVTVNEEIKTYIDTSYKKDLVYAVTFRNTEGNLTVFVDVDQETIVGKGFLTY